MELKTAPVANFFSALSVLVPEILWNVKTRGKTVVLFVGSSKSCEKYLDTKGIAYVITTPDNITSGAINIVHQKLGVSFELVDHDIVVYSVGTPRNSERPASCTCGEMLSQYGCTSEHGCNEFFVPPVGAYVVHEKHGLGRFLGTKKMSLGADTREYFILQYDGGAFVYLPVENVNQLYNYYGSPRRLDRI